MRQFPCQRWQIIVDKMTTLGVLTHCGKGFDDARRGIWGSEKDKELRELPIPDTTY